MMSATSDSKRSTIAFFALAYLISWACWIPAVLLGQAASAATATPEQAGSLVVLLQILGSYGPTLAAVLMLALLGPRGELKDLLARLRPRRVGVRWVAIALLLPLGALLPGLIAYGLLGGAVAGAELVALLPMLLVSVLVSGLGEELGWRGYALPRLQRRNGPLAASVIVGLLWAVWHLPVYYSASAQSGVLFALEFVLYSLIVVSFSVILTWAYNATDRSLWMVVLMHAALTAAGNTVMVAIAPAKVGTWVPYTVSVLSACGTAILVAVLSNSSVPAPEMKEVLGWANRTQA
jgi:membrane protease YdiL (CAAX protease family)